MINIIKILNETHISKKLKRNIRPNEYDDLN